MTRKDSQDKNRKKQAGLDSDAKQGTSSGQIMGQAIGKRLRTYYDHIIVQPVPDRFVELLKRLEEREADEKSG